MRRAWWFRPFATLLTVWLPLIIGEPSMLQPCPMHGSVAIASASAAAGHAAHGGHGGHVGHAVSHTGTHGADASTPSDEQAPGHHHCSCIGCCAGSPALVPVFEGPTSDVVVATYTAGGPATVESLPRLAPEHSRPYTTGPPRP